MYTNTDITFYSVGSNGSITRHAITGKNGKKAALWDEVKQANILKSGLASSDTIKIMIPAANIPEGLTFSLAKDMVVKGIIDFEFDNTSDATRASSLKTLKATNTIYAVNAADAKLFGSPGMQHYQLSCK